MPRATKREESEYQFPEGEYFPCVLAKVDEKEIVFQKKDRKTGQKMFDDNGQPVMSSFYKWVWFFDVVDGEYRGQTIYGETPAEYTTREDDRVRQWAEALLGRELEVGEELDTDEMLNGLPCFVSVRHGGPREKRDGGYFYPCEVDDVMPRTAGPADAPPF